MKLEILSYIQAQEFIPKTETAIMRIYSANPHDNAGYGKLKSSPLWIGEFKYIFDDIDCMNGEEMDRNSRASPDENPDVSFMSRDIARQIVRDFNSVKNNIECLVIHCRYGMGRSAAVGMALNEAFKLGDSTFRMSKEFPKFNQAVYELVLEAGLEKKRK